MIFFISFYTGITLFGVIRANLTKAATITWDGGGGVDTNWSTATNWSTDSLPTATDIVVFDGTNTGDSTIDAGFNGTVAGITIDAAYTGTITQSRSLTISGDLFMATSTAGTFLGGSDIIDINGSLNILSGTFRASSATTSIAQNFRPMGGTFNDNHGIISIDGSGNGPSYINIPENGLSLENLTLNKANSGGILGDISFEENEAGTFTITGTLNLVSGSLTRTNRVSGMTNTLITATGQVYLHNTMYGQYSLVTIAGTNQTINYTSGGVGTAPPILLNASDAVFNMTGTATGTFRSITINAGTFNANNANIYTSSLFLSGSTSYFNSSSSIYIDDEFRCYYGSSATFGTGFVQIGVTVRTFADCTIDAHNASSLIFRRSNGAAVSTFILGYQSGTLTDGHITWWLPQTTTTIAAATISIAAGATLDPNGGTVVLDGASQTITGSPTFYNLTKTVTATSTLYFPSSNTITVQNNLILEGTSSSSMLSVRSSTTGTQAMIDIQGTASLRFLEVRDLNNTNTDTTVAGATVFDNGNNSGFSGMIDITPPTAPGPLVLSSISPGTATFSLNTTSSDANFSSYLIAYKAGTSEVVLSDTNFTSTSDSNLSSATLNGSTATVTGIPTPNTQYVFNVWAYDEYGNYTTSTGETTFYTSANNPSNTIISGLTFSGVTISWNTNSNPEGTEYRIDDTSGNSSVTTGWITTSTYSFTELISNQTYNFYIKARNASSAETTAVSVGRSIVILTSGGGGGTGSTGGTTSPAPTPTPTPAPTPEPTPTPTPEPTTPDTPDTTGGTEDTTPTTGGSTNTGGNSGGNSNSGNTSGGTSGSTGGSGNVAGGSTQPSSGGSGSNGGSFGSGTIQNRVASDAIGFWIGNGLLRTSAVNGELKTLENDTLNIVINDNAVGMSDITSGTVSLNNTEYSLTHDTNRGIWIAAVSPNSSGNHQFRVSLSHSSGNKDVFTWTLRTEEYGGIFDAVTNVPLYGAVVSIFANPSRELWNASIYGQINPITTTADGKFGFIVPNGEYTLRIEKQGFDVVEDRLTVNDHIVSLNKFLTQSVTFEPKVEEKVVLSPEIQLDAQIKKNLETITNKIEETIKVSETAGKVSEKLEEFSLNPTVQVATRRIVPPVSVGVTTIAFFPILAQTTVPLLQYLFLQPMLFLGLRKRKSWGTVYNSLSKMPVDLAIVRLVNAETGRIAQTTVTDRYGRYLFSVNKPAAYRIEVQKAGLVFPSIITSALHTDGEFIDLYHGETLTIPDATARIVAPHIPLDPKENPNQKIQGTKIEWKYITRYILAATGIVTTSVSFLITRDWSVGGFVVIQVIGIIAAKRFAKPPVPRKFGVIRDAQTKKPIPSAIVRLYNNEYKKLVATNITDAKGQYSFLVGPGTYFVSIEKPGYKTSGGENHSIKNYEDGLIAADITLLSQTTVQY